MYNTKLNLREKMNQETQIKPQGKNLIKRHKYVENTYNFCKINDKFNI